MTLRELQPEALVALDATLARARAVTDPRLLARVEACIECHVADGPPPPPPEDERAADVQAVIEQMLVDVSRLDDDTVRRAARHFDDGGLADLVMASYVLEAAARLRVSSAALLGGFG